MHFCFDEFMALVAFIPVLGLVVNWFRSRIEHWRNRHRRPYCMHGPSFHKEPYEPITLVPLGDE